MGSVLQWQQQLQQQLVVQQPAEDKDDFTIMLVSAGDKKINVIKEVRAATS